MKTETRIRILIKAYKKTLVTQKIVNKKAFHGICDELEKLTGTPAFDELVAEVRELTT